MSKRPTVYDVAQAAGVSTATVSFSFAKPERVKDETRRVVLETAERLGYVPSASARGLASGTTGALGLFAFDYLLEGDAESASGDGRLFPLYVDEVQRGVQLESRERGYVLMLGGGRDPGGRPPLVDIAGRVDGLIAFEGSVQPELLVKLAERIPVIHLGGDTHFAGLHTILVDGGRGMRELTDHLIDVHEHRRHVYVGAPGSPEFGARYDGFAQALVAHGLPVPAQTPSQPGDDESTVRVVQDVLTRDSLPDVFVCATDQEALVTIDVLERAGIRVPDDVAVTGYDGIIAGRLSRPRLTTIRQPMELIGRSAVRMLTEIIAGNDDADRHEVLKTALHIGQSCGC